MMSFFLTIARKCRPPHSAISPGYKLAPIGVGPLNPLISIVHSTLQERQAPVPITVTIRTCVVIGK
jgi:hypothetical protein